jgi:hypothetical protein
MLRMPFASSNGTLQCRMAAALMRLLFLSVLDGPLPLTCIHLFVRPEHPSINLIHAAAEAPLAAPLAWRQLLEGLQGGTPRGRV